MNGYRVLSQAELDTELVAGDKLDLVYDFGSASSYWLGYWADRVDRRLGKIDIYDVTSYTNNGDGTVTFHVTIKPYVVRMSDGARISVETYRKMHDAELQGYAVKMLTEPVEAASPGVAFKLIAGVLIAWAVAYSFKIAYLWSTGQSAGKGMLESLADMGKSTEGIVQLLVIAFVAYVAWKVLE